MKKTEIVMISSTARDLPEYRQIAMDVCLRLGKWPKMMEHLPALDADATKASLDMVEEADIYLCILAHRYGSIPAGEEISYTEIEHDRAVERGVPRWSSSWIPSIPSHRPGSRPAREPRSSGN